MRTEVIVHRDPTNEEKLLSAPLERAGKENLRNRDSGDNQDTGNYSGERAMNAFYGPHVPSHQERWLT